jgi:hypothetical protein
MHIAIPRRTLILLALVIVAIIAVIAVPVLKPAHSEPEAQVQVTTISAQEWGQQWEQTLANAPEEMVMSDGVPALRGRATCTGLGEGGIAFITVKLDSGKEYGFIVDIGKTNVFRSEDVFAHPNQPAPTVENPIAALESLKDIPVFVRYDPGDPPQMRSIIILGGVQ